MAADAALSRLPAGPCQSAADFLTLVRARLGALDLAAGGEALVAQHPHLLDLGRWPPLLLYLRTLTSRGPGMRSSRSAFSFGGIGRHSTSSLPMCWIGAAPSSSAQRAQHRLARGAVVGEARAP